MKGNPDVIVSVLYVSIKVDLKFHIGHGVEQNMNVAFDDLFFTTKDPSLLLINYELLENDTTVPQITTQLSRNIRTLLPLH